MCCLSGPKTAMGCLGLVGRWHNGRQFSAEVILCTGLWYQPCGSKRARPDGLDGGAVCQKRRPRAARMLFCNALDLAELCCNPDQPAKTLERSVFNPLRGEAHTQGPFFRTSVASMP
jgi:hypothetical protein